jgi:hypothetical protein
MWAQVRVLERSAFGLGMSLCAVAGPRAARACDACIAAAAETDPNRMAFFWTTALLSVLPLTMIGGVIAWFAWRARALRSRQALEFRDPARERAASGVC